MKFYFSDGQNIGVWEDGKASRFESNFIHRYKETAISIENSHSWKYSGQGAVFRGDVAESQAVHYTINGIFPTADKGQVAYSFTVNQTSGVYLKRTDDEKAEEAHLVNSLESGFGSGCTAADGSKFAITVNEGAGSHIAIMNAENGDYNCVTEGDTVDLDPHISRDNPNIIYYSSRGAGRNADGQFVEYSPAAICKLNLSEASVEEIAASPKYSYFKPIMYGGKLYALRTPVKEKGPNPFNEILLIPFRIVQAIANFINAFVRAFTGKSLATGGNNPTKERNTDSRKLFIKGNLINVEKELKRNKKRGEDTGFIPLSWQIVEVESGKAVKSGVADYDVTDDGEFIATDGRHIFVIKDGKSKKVCDAENCLTVSACPEITAAKTEKDEIFSDLSD